MLAKQLAVMENLTEFSALSKSPNRKRLVEEFLVHSRSLVLYDYARVWLFNDSDAILSCTSEHPIRKSHSSIGKMRRIGESLIGRVAERGSSMIVQDVRRDIRHPIHKFSERQKTQIGPIAQMILPLIVNGETMGVVEFERRQWGAFNIADRNRIQGLITLVAMGLANIRQHQDVMQLAATDGLTGMYNKRHIMTLLQDEMRRGERYSRPLAVLMMDIDYFKNYNDTYGHVQGDTLLAQMSMIIQESIRSTDRAGRYGGEEFIIVMPETDKEAAFSTAERIRQRIEMTPFPGKPKAPDTLPASLSDCFPETAETWVRKTISIGVSCFPRDAHDLTSLVALADDALYQAKRAGRNRVIAASEARQPRAAST
jgi:diguanylate cyclase (GGDEF)-like protein